MNDPINPNHYKQGGLESIDAIKAFMSEEAFKGFLKGNCQKYLFRYEQKNGIEDLKKCQWYLERLISVLEEKQTSADLLCSSEQRDQLLAFRSIFRSRRKRSGQMVLCLESLQKCFFCNAA